MKYGDQTDNGYFPWRGRKYKSLLNLLEKIESRQPLEEVA